MLRLTKLNIAIATLALVGPLSADMSDQMDQKIQQQEDQQQQLIDSQLGGYDSEVHSLENNTEFEDFENVQPGFNR